MRLNLKSNSHLFLWKWDITEGNCGVNSESKLQYSFFNSQTILRSYILLKILYILFSRRKDLKLWKKILQKRWAYRDFVDHASRILKSLRFFLMIFVVVMMYVPKRVFGFWETGWKWKKKDIIFMWNSSWKRVHALKFASSFGRLQIMKRAVIFGPLVFPLFFIPVYPCFHSLIRFAYEIQSLMDRSMIEG